MIFNLFWIDCVYDGQRISLSLYLIGLLQKETPGVAVSVKTHQAARRILNLQLHKVHDMRSEAIIDEGQCCACRPSVILLPCQSCECSRMASQREPKHSLQIILSILSVRSMRAQL